MVKKQRKPKQKPNSLVRSKQHARDHLWFYMVSGLAFLTFFIFSYFSYRKFMYPMLDLGLFNRHMWGMVHGNFGPNPLKLPTELNLLGDHSHFILFLYAPIYFLWQNAYSLVLIQIVALILSGYPLYKIALKYFKDKRVAAGWLVPYFMFFGFWSGQSYAFHEVFLALPIIAWALYFLLEDHFKPMLVCLALLLLVKENMPLLVIMFGLYIIIMRRQYKKGGLLLGVGAAYFIAVTQYWLPWFGNAPYVYSDNVFGKGTADVAKAAVQTPKEFVRQLFLPLEKTKSIVFMLFSFGGLPLIGLEILVLLSPLWLGRFLSTQPWRWSVIQHYSADQAPILLVAAIVGAHRLYKLASRYGLKVSRSQVGVAAVCICVVGSIAVHIRIDERYPQRLIQPAFYSLSAADKSTHKALSLIPRDSSVAAQAAFPQLSSRREIYNLPIDLSQYKPGYIVAAQGYDMWPFASVEELNSFIQRAVERFGYEQVFLQNGVVVLRRN